MKVKTRGRETKHWAEKARVLVWYWEIKRRTSWSDRRLDMELVLTEDVKKSLDQGSWPRTFARIRKTATQPSRGGHWRSNIDLIQIAEAHPTLTGTLALYEADIWNIFQEEAPSPKDVERRIQVILKRYSLVRVDLQTSDFLLKWALKKGEAALFDRCLQFEVKKMAYLDQIVFLWSIYLQMDRASDWEIRSCIERRIDEWLDTFFCQSFIESRDSYFYFYHEAVNALLKTRLDMKDSETDPRRQSEHFILSENFLNLNSIVRSNR